MVENFCRLSILLPVWGEALRIGKLFTGSLVVIDIRGRDSKKSQIRRIWTSKP